MKYFLAIIGFCLGLFIILYLVSVLWESYKWLRRKLNKPLIGYEKIDIKLLRRDDYVCIDGKTMRFNHFTKLGEMAFNNPLALGSYFIYQPSSLNKCLFIYGKYGARWAASEHWASVAKEKVEEYIYS